MTLLNWRSYLSFSNKFSWWEFPGDWASNHSTTVQLVRNFHRVQMIQIANDPHSVQNPKLFLLVLPFWCRPFCIFAYFMSSQVEVWRFLVTVGGLLPIPRCCCDRLRRVRVVVVKLLSQYWSIVAFFLLLVTLLSANNVWQRSHFMVWRFWWIFW